MWLGLVQSVEGLHREALTSLEQEELHWETASELKLQHYLFPESPVYQPTLQILDFPTSTIMSANPFK